MDKSYALMIFGCQMNIHDAERIRGALETEGWSEASPQEADAIVLLTCCVRESAERRLFGRLSSLKPLKDSKRVVIAVGGCLAQKEGLRILEKAPYVDLVFGTQQYPRIAGLLREAEAGAVCNTRMDGLYINGMPYRRRENFRAWITITHGCDNHCSYCIVPRVRGEEESRPMRDVMDEACIHASEDVREINLLGQNVNSYRRKEEGRSRFGDLLTSLGEACPNTWIRFTTSHPRDFDAAIIKAIADTANVCEYVHLPLQAGSNRILAAMNRGYTREAYLEKAGELQRSVEGVSLTTDIIVGFPGETDEDFGQTLEMLESCRFDAAFTFIYNPREGTAAARLADDVPEALKHERLEKLMEITRGLTAASLKKEIGREQTVLVYGASRKNPGRWEARTRNNKLVHFTRTEVELSGKFARVLVTKAGNWSLHAELKEVLG